MRRVYIAVSGALALAACGGGSDGGTGSITVVPSAATPTPTPTPTPTSTSTPTPTPTSSYAAFTSLTGDQSFQTACASLVLGTGLPTPQAAAPFGESLALGYTAASSSWSINGDSVAQTFAGSEAVTAPAGQQIYQHVANGSTQQLTITAPNASGTTLSYTRTLGLRTDRSAGTTLYSCVFGVPSLTADIPTAAVTYSRVNVTGTAYLLNSAGTVQTYILSASTGTANYNASGAAVTLSIHLVGYLQTGSTLATTATDLGTYTGNGSVEAAKVRFSGSLDSADRVSLFSSFTGAFFGGVEVGTAFDILASDPSTGNRVAAVGTLVAAQ